MTAIRMAYVCGDRGVPVVGRGGSSAHVHELVRSLVARGTKVTVFAAQPADAAACGFAEFPVVDLCSDEQLADLHRRIAKAARASGGSLARASETYGVLLNQTLVETLWRRRGEFDVVYERQSLWSFGGLQFARRHGVPFLLEVNAPLTEQQSAYRDLELADTARGIEGYLLAGADRVLVTTPTLIGYAQAHGASARRIRVLPCGVSSQRFRADRPLGLRNAEEFVLGFVGSLKPWHGVDVLLEAFRQLSQLSERYRLLIVGDGPQRPQVQEFCRAHALQDRVTLVGDVDRDRVPQYLAQIDVGLAPYPPLPSFYFSPLKVWEYAAGGVPIVASASGELPRLFPHKTAALLHPPGNVRKVVKHIERLRHDNALAERLARHARRVAKLHTWDRLAARLETIVRHTITEKRQASATAGEQ